MLNHKKNVFIVGSGGMCAYARMYHQRGWNVVREMQSASLVQFTGGSDVTPSLYLEKSHHSTYNHLERDMDETREFHLAYALGLPMVGICRGGQFLNVMCGGKLHQDVDGHGLFKGHTLYTEDGREVWVSSTHHQMMIKGAGGRVLGHGGNLSLCKSGADYEDRTAAVDDLEVVSYREHKVLCFQPHPELNGFEACQDYFFKLLDEM